jgi:ADP-heptose:LPS heptosyltransferase
MLNTAKWLVYELILVFSKMRFRPKADKEEKILLVKTDELGDYILFRNYLPPIIAALKTSNKMLVFVGNALWKPLFESFDLDEAIITTIWLNKNKFKKDLRYRFSLLRQIGGLQYSQAYNLVVSRSRRVDDMIISAARAPQNIGYVNDSANMTRLEAFFNSHLYQITIPLPPGIHDFEKHYYFLQYLSPKSALPALSLPTVNNTVQLPTLNYVLLFPGSGNKERIWDTEKFIQVAEFIQKEYGYSICLAGAPTDVVYANLFKSRFKGTVIDFCGKTTLTQLIELTQNSRFVLAIDTGAVHMAAACNILCFGIYNGDRYARFAPYPNQLKKKIYPVYPPAVDEQIATAAVTGGNIVSKAGKYDEVTAEKVIAQISLVLRSNHSNK